MQYYMRMCLIPAYMAYAETDYPSLFLKVVHSHYSKALISISELPPFH